MVLPQAPRTILSEITENRSNNGEREIVNDAAAGARRRTHGGNQAQGNGGERSQMQQDGAIMYREFLTSEFQRRNLPNPEQYILDGAAYHNSNNPSPDLNRAVDQLRIVAAEFSQTPMRQWVEQQAALVPLETLDFQAFSQLLYGLFQEGGVTWERIIVLFYFSTDVAARALRETVPQRFQNIVEWSFLFFSGDWMIQWVFDHGGWLAALQNSACQAYRVAKMSAFLIGVVALGVYFWRSHN